MTRIHSFLCCVQLLPSLLLQLSRLFVKIFIDHHELRTWCQDIKVPATTARRTKKKQTFWFDIKVFHFLFLWLINEINQCCITLILLFGNKKNGISLISLILLCACLCLINQCDMFLWRAATAAATPTYYVTTPWCIDAHNDSETIKDDGRDHPYTFFPQRALMPMVLWYILGFTASKTWPQRYRISVSNHTFLDSVIKFFCLSSTTNDKSST